MIDFESSPPTSIAYWLPTKAKPTPSSRRNLREMFEEACLEVLFTCLGRKGQKVEVVRVLRDLLCEIRTRRRKGLAIPTTVKRPPTSCRNRPSGICERAELPVQRIASGGQKAWASGYRATRMASGARVPKGVFIGRGDRRASKFWNEME